jgi:peptidoglycan/LPS O-acetylase OafA/YrhL
MLPTMSQMRGGTSIVGQSISLVATISYSMYLLNFTVLGYVMSRAFKGFHDTASLAVIKYFVFWSLTVCTSWLLYRFWERPMMALRDRGNN